jgi:hypothetical protein
MGLFFLRPLTFPYFCLCGKLVLKGDDYVPKKSPWHSVKKDADPVYHDNSNCNTGNNIEKENIRQGTGGRPLCSECAGLDRAGK